MFSLITFYFAFYFFMIIDEIRRVCWMGVQKYVMRITFKNYKVVFVIAKETHSGDIYDQWGCDHTHPRASLSTPVLMKR